MSLSIGGEEPADDTTPVVKVDDPTEFRAAVLWIRRRKAELEEAESVEDRYVGKRCRSFVVAGCLASAG